MQSLRRKVGYFRESLSTNPGVHESVRPLLRFSRETVVGVQKTEYALVSSLNRDPLLVERVTRVRTVPESGTHHGSDVDTGDG
jgi:transposase